MAKRHYHAHETARADELDGLPLASIGQRALGLLIADSSALGTTGAAAGSLAKHEWNGRSHYGITFSFHEWRVLLVALLYFAPVNYSVTASLWASGSPARGWYRRSMNPWGSGSVSSGS